MIALGLVAVDYENYSSLKLTEESRAVLRGETKIQLRQYKKAEKAVKHKRQSAKDFSETNLSESEQAIFERLRWWRVETAKAHNTAAFIIFHDTTLREIAKAKPRSLDDLRGVTGVGAKKLESYGEELVKLIAEFL
jgi:ATP-dependent DNA helicase RecQ